MLSGLMILPFCGTISSYLRSVTRAYKLILLISLLQTFLLYGCFFIGMTLIPGALGAIVIGSSPLVAALTAHFLMTDDELTAQKTTSIVIGIGGVAIISMSRQPWSSAGFLEVLGVALLLVGSLCSALSNVLIAKDKDTVNALILNSAQMFIGGFLLFLVSLPVEGLPRFALPPAFYGALLWLSFLSAAAVSIWFILLKRPEVKVSDLNLWKFIIPVCGAILSWALLADESPELFSVMGMLCVAVSIYTYHKSARNEVSRL